MDSVFRYNVDIRKNAYMNWRLERNAPIDNMISIAEGYMTSALMNTADLLKNNNGSKADAVIFPILFNVNHGIELYLKAINWSLNILMGTDYKIEGKHDIRALYTMVKRKIDRYEETKETRKTFLEMTKSLDEYINKLYSLMRTGNAKVETLDFSRYPFDRDKNNHFYVETFDNITVDLEHFQIIFSEISKSLFNISTHYLYRIYDEI